MKWVWSLQEKFHGQHFSVTCVGTFGFTDVTSYLVVVRLLQPATLIIYSSFRACADRDVMQHLARVESSTPAVTDAIFSQDDYI